MKTSNIILISLLGSVTLAISVGAMQLRLTGKVKPGLGGEIRADTLNIQPFRFLILKNADRLTMRTHPDPKLIIQNEGDKPSRVYHHASGDTLYVDSVHITPRDRAFWLTIQTPVNAVELIHATSATIKLEGISDDSMRIFLDKSNLRIAGSFATGRLFIVAGNGSYLGLETLNVDMLNLVLNQSRARLGRVDTLTGILENHSSVSAPNTYQINLRKDSTSSWVP